MCDRPGPSQNGAFPVETYGNDQWYNLHMKECRQCFELKELTAFYKDASYPDGHKARCKDCECARHRQKRATGSIEPGSRPIEDQRRLAYLQKLFRKFDGKTEVVIPVNALNNPHPAKRACVIRAMSDKNRILISSIRGVREYEFELVSPEYLLAVLKELHLQVHLP